LVLSACTLTLAEDKKEAGLDPAKLVGTWNYVSAEKNGEKVPEDRLKMQSVIFTKDKLTLKSQDSFVLKYTIDTKKKPATIDLEIVEGPFAVGEKTQGIIELNGDELKICYAVPGGPAPAKFDGKEGTKAHYMVLKRAKTAK
jgi:uncharacterized protein (TIGR03067 family)